MPDIDGIELAEILNKKSVYIENNFSHRVRFL